MYGESFMPCFKWGNLRELNSLEVPGVDGNIILKWILENLNRDMDCVDVGQYRDRWRTLVNAVMNIGVS
jgi:hypothetical protein